MTDRIIIILFGLAYFGCVTITLFILAAKRLKQDKIKEWIRADSIARFMLAMTILYCMVSVAVLITLKLIRG